LIKLCYHAKNNNEELTFNLQIIEIKDFSYYARAHVISADPNNPFAGFTIEFCAAVAVLLTGITYGMLYELIYWWMH